MKNRTLTLILCITAYALAGSSLFAQSQGPANVWTSGTGKGQFANPLIVPANSGTGANQFANGADTKAALDGKLPASRMLGTGTLTVNSTGTIGSAAFTESTAYATSAQGGLADSALQPGEAAADISGGSGALDLSIYTLTLPADVTRLGSSIDLASEVTGTLPGSAVQISGTGNAGAVTLATDAEIETGTDTAKVVRVSGLAAFWSWVKTQAQTISGNWSWTGNTTMGDAPGDSHTINAGTFTAPNATAVGSSSVANVGTLDGRYQRQYATYLAGPITLNNEATLQSSGLVLSGIDPGTYILTIRFVYTSSTTTPGLKIRMVTVSGGVTPGNGVSGMRYSASGGTSSATGNGTGSMFSADYAQPGTSSGTWAIYLFSGMPVVISTTASIRLDWAQNTATAENSSLYSAFLLLEKL